ncbi:hypothetical protein F4818DRAFT_437207 [Hypoxylon cercidicola]|nr:hypothetical protein F4818DRAFT_437207 [Hypoxylon cercidicola]
MNHTKVMEYFGAENPGLRVVSVHPGVVTQSEGGRRFAASEEADFLKNKFVFAAWDVDELKARKDEIARSPELIIGLNGFPRNL